MKYIQLILVFVTFSITISCNNDQTKQITNTKDYRAYLNTSKNKSLENAEKEVNFWETKLQKTPNQYPYHSKIASANSKIFKLSGEINNLKEAEKNLLAANQKTNYNSAGYLRSLASNYISQHRFKEALELLTKAEYNGEKLKQTHLMLIDVHLELGNMSKVGKYLSKVKNFKDFDYLIRVSKYNDHIGNLNNAIKYLEAALAIAKSSNNQDLMQWNYTNLADYYGHAGRINDSYNGYLNALAINPNNSYAKKGIAWIVYSYERNPKEALRILETVTRENAAPDYHLLKAKIAGFMGDALEKENQTKLYIAKVDDKNYGAMYAKYNILLYADDTANQLKALEIAIEEVAARPTAQSYDLLAWSYYKNGSIEKALEISKKHVIGKTFEPEALLHTAHILKANGNQKEAQKLKAELLGAIYELGPASEQEIKNI
ncbi:MULTISPECIES: tetratricopeptide repeat protein [unclassified Polaribacter]|uniref:tetratricopeptide repeat protein n=1 Tax=unclassified Polaribacter TaxID=196858 RepID=UPI0011BD8F81|nr:MULTISPECIES: cell surface protein [unclassified Polaribacter]TXD51184.1 cell surface protein [Polaribacter sp. IC063]TXD59089.1 cell surface protein [Polaribacter sp. IC066]